MSTPEPDVKMEQATTVDTPMKVESVQPAENGSSAPAPTTSDAPGATTSANSSTVPPTATPSGGNRLQQLQRMNQYFKAHGLSHSDQQHQQYMEYCRQHPGQEPPVTLFSTPANAAGFVAPAT